MLISDATMRALDGIAQRQQDLLTSFPAGDASVRAPQNSYFVVQDAPGRFTYNAGASFIMRDGALLDEAERPVMGYRSPGGPLEPLRADPVDTALGLAGEVSVDASGRVTFHRQSIDPQSGAAEIADVPLGTIALARFAAGSNANGGAAPHFGTARDGNFGSLSPFAARSAGVDASLEHLQRAYLVFDAIHAAAKAEGGTQKTAMDLLK